MKKIFYLGFSGLLLFEIANVYFIMPMPGSQQMNSIDLAYFLYSWRWVFRIVFASLLLFGWWKAKWRWPWTLSIPLLLLAVVIYLVNFKMAADAMFKQPGKIILADVGGNKVKEERLVIGIEKNGVAKAYPIQYLGYHHFVYDTISGSPVLVTYCTVCRTGRVFDPVINGKTEKFRLVGMDHFNAMIEDAATGSWWRQATGEAIAGKLKGTTLKEIHSTQTSLAQWLKLYPHSMIMQADAASLSHYDTSFNYENGSSKSQLTGTNAASWQNKSWVIGVRAGDAVKAFDWNELKKQRLLQGRVGTTNAIVVLAGDNKSFFAYENYGEFPASLNKDTILVGNVKFNLAGKGIDTSFSLKPLNAYQEFWHSWKYFAGDKR